MQRRTLAAITDAVQGRVPQATTPAVPVQRAAEPDAQAVQAFARKLRETMGALQSVSKVHEDISGSPLAPTVALALVLQFEKGSVTGSATMQWLPASEQEAQVSWLPSAHVLELDISLPDGSSAVLRPADTGAPSATTGSTPVQTPATAPSTPPTP